MPEPAPRIEETDERPAETEAESEPGRQPATEPIDWAPCGCWMDPDTAKWIDRDPWERGR